MYFHWQLTNYFIFLSQNMDLSNMNSGSLMNLKNRHPNIIPWSSPWWLQGNRGPQHQLFHPPDQWGPSSLGFAEGQPQNTGQPDQLQHGRESPGLSDKYSGHVSTKLLTLGNNLYISNQSNTWERWLNLWYYMCDLDLIKIIHTHKVWNNKSKINTKLTIVTVHLSKPNLTVRHSMV